jgi:hypothetical protein
MLTALEKKHESIGRTKRRLSFYHGFVQNLLVSYRSQPLDKLAKKVEVHVH